MEQNNFKEKLNSIVSGKQSRWAEKASWRRANKGWLLRSAAIALKIMQALKEKKWTQAELASKLGMSAAQLSQIVKGQENFSLELVSKIESALNIKLLVVPAQPVSENSSWPGP